jgi:secondary thiamine-phosphate synthase enzyme
MKAKEITIKTGTRHQYVNIDQHVQTYIDESGLEEGVCVLFVPHTTAGITINENADPDVVKDIQSKLDRDIPQNDRYRHREGNSDAHIKSSLIGPSLTLVIQNGQLLLGTWQSVYFCEFDGPRSRRLILKAISD